MHPVNFFNDYFLFFYFFTPQSRFSWVSESFSQDIGRISDFNLESFFFTKTYLSMKTLTDFLKTVETGVDPRLPCLVFSPSTNRKIRHFHVVAVK